MSSVESLLSGEGLRLGQREKVWMMVFVWVMVGLWGYRTFAHPRAKMARDAWVEMTEAREELNQLEAGRPDVRQLEAKIRDLQKQVGDTYKELETLEEGLLYRRDVDLLLERLVSDQKRLNLRINAVEPLKDSPDKTSAQASQAESSKAPSFYKRVFVQVDASASFDRLIAYLEALEDQGPYQRVRGVQVKMEKKESGGEEVVRPRALVLVESLLADTAERRSEQQKKIFSLMEEISAREEKDPFLARERPREEKEAVDLSLSGIFGREGDLSALIDGEVRRVGDLVKGKRVVEISPDRVILEQADQRYILMEKGLSSE